jgi:hypothetical protein
MCYAIRCLDEKAQYKGRYRLTVGYPNDKNITVSKSDFQVFCMFIDLFFWGKLYFFPILYSLNVLTHTLSRSCFVVLDYRTTDLTKVNQPGPEHAILHPSSKYLFIVYFVVTPNISGFLMKSTIVAEAQKQKSLFELLSLFD